MILALRQWRRSAALGAVLMVVTLTPAAAAPTLTRTLDNGMKVAVFSDRRLPIVHIQILIPAGSRDEGPAESGAARITSHLLARGTTSRDASTFVRDVEALGGTVRADASRDFASFSGSFRSADYARSLELVADAIMNPIFPQSEFDGTRRQILGSLYQSRRLLDVLADEHVWGRAMGRHPYAIPEGGTLEGVAGLTRARVIAFHRAHYRPGGVLVAIAGDVDAGQAMAAVQETFSGWGGQAQPRASTPVPGHPPGIRLVDIPGAEEAEIRLAIRVPARGSEERYPLTVANDLLGAGPQSRLGGGSRVMRTYSDLQLSGDAGLLVLGAAARNDSVPAVLGRLRAELGRFAAEPPTAAEVERSRRAIARSYAIHLEGIGSQAAQWLTSVSMGAGEDEPDRFPERIEAVTAEAVAATAKRLFDPATAEIVVVGAASALESGLSALGAVEVVPMDAPPTPLSLAPAMQTGEPTSASIELGRGLVQQAVTAHGGLARLRSIKDMRLEGNVTLYNEGESVTGKHVELRREPFQLRIETTFMQISTVQALYGDTAWSRVTAAAGDSVIDEDAAGVEGLRHSFSSDVPHVLIAASDPKSRVAHRGRETVGAGEAEVVEVATESGRWVLFIDRDRRVVAIEENQGSPLRGPALRRVFGDFRAVGGISLPHSEERLLNGERTLTLLIRSAKINSGIPAAAFQRPPRPEAAGHRRR